MRGERGEVDWDFVIIMCVFMGLPMICLTLVAIFSPEVLINVQ
jgi:hypothetical protein